MHVVFVCFIVATVCAVQTVAARATSFKGTCRGELLAYLDTNQVSLANSLNPSALDEFNIPSDASILTLRCKSSMDILGVIGQFDNGTVTSGNGWKCTHYWSDYYLPHYQFPYYWLYPDYDDTRDWDHPVIYGPSDLGDETFSPNAQWIWNKDHGNGDYARNVWCKGPLPTGVSQLTLKGVCSGRFEVYTSTNKLTPTGTYTDRSVATYAIPSDATAITMRCRIPGETYWYGPGEVGLIAQYSNGYYTNVNDFKCTYMWDDHDLPYYNFPYYWLEPDYNDQSAFVTEVVPKPEGIEGGVDLPNAKYIWSPDNYSERHVWCRARL